MKSAHPLKNKKNKKKPNTKKQQQHTTLNATLCVLSVFIRYSIGPSYDGNWGVADKTGFWNGMVGMVHREVGISGLQTGV